MYQAQFFSLNSPKSLECRYCIGWLASGMPTRQLLAWSAVPEVLLTPVLLSLSSAVVALAQGAHITGFIYRNLRSIDQVIRYCL